MNLYYYVRKIWTLVYLKMLKTRPLDGIVLKVYVEIKTNLAKLGKNKVFKIYTSQF